MPEPALQPRSLLEPALAELAGTPSGDGPVLLEVPFITKLEIRALEGLSEINRAVAPVLGLSLDDIPNRAAGSDGLVVYWFRPGHWLAVAGPERRDELLAGLERALAGLESSVVDLSDYYTALDLSGPGCLEVMKKGCTLDLHPAAFPPGSMARTLLARADVLLHHLERTGYRLFVRTSFAEYLLRWLHDAGLEYGIAVCAPEAERRKSANPSFPHTANRGES